MTALTLRGDASNGLSLFLRNCAGCHGMNGRGGMAPEIGNPVFQRAATDEFIIRTIRNGRVATAMPAFQRNRGAGVQRSGHRRRARLFADTRRTERSKSDGAERDFRNSSGRQAMSDSKDEPRTNRRNLSRGATLSKPPP